MGGCLIQEGRSSGHKACHGARPHAAASPRPCAPPPEAKSPQVAASLWIPPESAKTLCNIILHTVVCFPGVAGGHF